jgi:hypothetical protein
MILFGRIRAYSCPIFPPRGQNLQLRFPRSLCQEGLTNPIVDQFQRENGKRRPRSVTLRLDILFLAAGRRKIVRPPVTLMRLKGVPFSAPLGKQGVGGPMEQGARNSSRSLGVHLLGSNRCSSLSFPLWKIQHTNASLRSLARRSEW